MDGAAAAARPGEAGSLNAAKSPASRLVVVVWTLVLPFCVYALPYVMGAVTRIAGDGVAVFTVDEPLYLAEAKAVADGRSATWNPWTRENGAATDAYRRFGGFLLVNAAGWWSDIDPTWGMALAAGLFAAGIAWTSYRALRRFLPSGTLPWVLAPLVVLFPWGEFWEVARLRYRTDDLTALAFGRPFTSQAGAFVFALGLLAVLRARERPVPARLAWLAAAVTLQIYTFPYAAPLTVGLYGALVLLGWRTAPGPWGRWRALLLPAVLLVPALAWAASSVLPASEEASSARSVPRFGGSGALLVALSLLAWWRRRSFPAPHALFPAMLGFATVAGRLADFVVPARFNTSAYVLYLVPVTYAWIVIPLVACAIPRGLVPRAVPYAAGLVVLVFAGAVYAGVCGYRDRSDRLRAQAEWVAALERLPGEPGDVLLTEGESVEGPGAWAGLFSPSPVFYAFDAENSTTPTLDERLWRRAWYHHWRGLGAADIDRDGTGVAKRYRRVFGAHNNAPSPSVLPNLRARLESIEAGRPEALAFLRRFRRIVRLDRAGSGLFDEPRLDRVLRRTDERGIGAIHLTIYEPK